MVSLQPAVDLILIRYINRLSDLLFVMARAVNHRAGAPEITMVITRSRCLEVRS